MLWFFVIPFALGLLLSSSIPLGIGWLCAGAVAMLLLTSYIHRRGVNAIPLLLMNALLLGVIYGQLRDVFGEGEETSSYAYQGQNKGVEKEVNPMVVKMEGTLATTGLEDSHRSLLSAMLLGDRSGLSQEQKTYFRRAGVQHLLALSGMHLGILLAIVSVLLLRRTRFTRWQWPVLLSTLVLMWLYVYMVGCPKSLLRAMLMSTLFLLGRAINRPTYGYEVLASAVLLMLVFDPQSITNIGAQLSVAALVGLVCFYPAIAGFWRMENPETEQSLAVIACRSSFLFSLSAWLFTMPIVLVYFHQVQVWSPLVSLVLIPLTTLILQCAVFLLISTAMGIPFLTPLLSTVTDGMMYVQDFCVQLSAHLPFASIEVPNTSWWQAGIIYLMLFTLGVVLHYRSKRVMTYALLLLFLLTALLFVMGKC